MAFKVDEDDFVVGDDLDVIDQNAVFEVNIKVFGVGGGGCNALEHMAKLGIAGVEYIAVNTDVGALRDKDGKLMRRVQIGKKCCKGRGAGNKPEVAAEAANEDSESIKAHLEGATMVFIAAGMGGGTGTGASPVIAKMAQEMGILTVGVVTKPFSFEREQKMNQALKGIAEMRNYVDALIIIPNQKLLSLNEKGVNMKHAFALVDDVLYRSVKIISDLVNNTSVINVDYADVRETLAAAGDAHIATGEASGDTKVEMAVTQVINSPLLETSIDNAKKLLVSVTISEDIMIEDIDDAMTRITNAAHPDVTLIYGFAYNNELKDTMQITVIATGFPKEGEERPVKAQSQAVESKRQQQYSSQYQKPSQDRYDAAVETTKTRGLGSLEKIITGSFDGMTDEDGFNDLQELFKRNGRK